MLFGVNVVLIAYVSLTLFCLFGSIAGLRRPFPRKFLALGILCGLISIPVLTFPPYTGGIQPPSDGRMTARARDIAFSLVSYRLEHGRFPEGKTSTEIFQKLIDAGEVRDPAMFYLVLKGKSPGKPGLPLTPENVCWDIAEPLDDKTPGNMPIVFPTGYQVNFVPDGAAAPLVEPYPPYQNTEWPSWWKKLHSWPDPKPVKGIAIGYGTGIRQIRYAFLNLETKPDGSYFIPHVVPPDFDSQGRTYYQLTPNGPLKP